MRVLINGELYDSIETPILVVFDDNEKEIFNMNRFVSAPEGTSVEEKQKLIETDLKPILASQIKTLLEDMEVI